MKKLTALFIFFLIIFFPIVNSFAQERYIVSPIPLKMDVYDNNKLTETKILASFYFYQDQSNNWQGYWQYIDFMPWEEDKAVMANMHTYAIDQGNITNFAKVNDNTYSFEMQMSTLGGNRAAKVIIKKLPNLKWQAEVNIFVYSEITNDTVNIKWLTSDKKFLRLKYKKIK